MRQILIILPALSLVLGVGCGSAEKCTLRHEGTGAVYPSQEERAVLEEYRELSGLRTKKLEELKTELEKNGKEQAKLEKDCKVWENWGKVPGDYEQLSIEKVGMQKEAYGKLLRESSERGRKLGEEVEKWEGYTGAVKVFLYCKDLRKPAEVIAKPPEPATAPKGREHPPLLKTEGE